MNTLTKYMEVYSGIKNKIIEDDYAIGAILPTGDELAQVYSCSKLTVKKGLDLLVKEGLLMRRRGFGTVVLRKPVESSLVLGPTAGLVNTVGEEHVTSKIHSFAIEFPSEKVANYLAIPKNEYIYHIIRSRYLDQEPYSVEEIFMPLRLIPGLEPKHIENSVYNYIEKELGLKMHTSHVWLKGDRRSQLDEMILGKIDDDFMMIVEKTVSLEDGAIFEYSITRHVSRNFIFEAVFVQN